jgi:signal transduction histidine kinase
MTTPLHETAATQPGLRHGLSGKVLLLTILFVMLGEILIFLPSIANFRITWLKNRVAQAEIAALAVEAAPDRMLSGDLRNELLMGAGVHVVALKKGDTRQLVLRGDRDPMIDAIFDLRGVGWLEAIWDAFRSLAAGDGRVIGVIDTPPNMSGDQIEMALDEEPLRAAMLRYAFSILVISVILSLMVAGLVFLALHRALVRPMRRLTANMVAFGDDPENPSRIIAPGNRRDEIGIAERELQAMQSELVTLLQQKNHLAALGLAVSKVSHDLRNMLASAQLISDRLAMVNDPTVQRFVPKLIASLDRAIDLCVQTLKFGRAQEAPPKREKFPLKALIDEAIDSTAVQASSRIVLYNNVPPGMQIDADRDQLFRILTNLARNAIQAIEGAQAEDERVPDGAVTFRAWREGTIVTLEVSDTGPGIPERVREHLFEAFLSAARPGGTGLGLAIAAELTRAHGGDIALSATSRDGTIFRITIPDRVTELRTGRRGERRPAAEA